MPLENIWGSLVPNFWHRAALSVVYEVPKMEIVMEGMGRCLTRKIKSNDGKRPQRNYFPLLRKAWSFLKTLEIGC